MTIKRLGVFSVGKVLGLLYGLMGLLFGALFSVLSLFGALAGMAATEGAGAGEAFVGFLFGVGAIIVLPVFYGVLGFVMGMLTALFYNFVSGLVGGIELEVEGG